MRCQAGKEWEEGGSLGGENNGKQGEIEGENVGRSKKVTRCCEVGAVAHRGGQGREGADS